MNNLNMHKTDAVRQAIVDVGATVIYLPTYSPELNPIEMLWADMKRDLRTLAVNVESELAAAIRRLRCRVPVEKIAGWFRHSRAQAQLN
jgi:transposase